MEYEHNFLHYVAEKMEGQNAESIIMALLQNEILAEEMKY